LTGTDIEIKHAYDIRIIIVILICFIIIIVIIIIIIIIIVFVFDDIVVIVLMINIKIIILTIIIISFIRLTTTLAGQVVVGDARRRVFRSLDCEGEAALTWRSTLHKVHSYTLGDTQTCCLTLVQVIRWVRRPSEDVHVRG